MKAPSHNKFSRNSAKNFTEKKQFSKKPFVKKHFNSPPPEKDEGFILNPDCDHLYGFHAVSEALKNPQRKFMRLFLTENAASKLQEAGIALPQGVETHSLHPRILDHLLKSADAVHQGFIAEAEPLKQPRLDQIPQQGIVVILDQVTDPHNVGAIMRSCAAFNVTALVSAARHSAEHSGVFFKAASGAFEHVPFVTVTNLARAIDELKSYGFHVVGLDSEAAENFGEQKKYPATALVLGSEGKGLRQLTRESCHSMIRLDMPGAIKSLNVSIAAALSLYALTH